MIARRFLLSLSALLLFVSISEAASKPNFTGTWQSDNSKSDFGGQPLPGKITRQVTQQGDLITMSATAEGPQGENKTDAKYVVDGKTETVNNTRLGPARSIATWKGDILEISTKLEIQGTAISSVETWTLSENGKVLTTKGSVTTPQGNLKTTLVMNKQE